MSLPSVDKSSLAAAVANGNLKEVSSILEKGGVDINQRSSDGFAPLCIAAFWGYADIVKLFLDHGADVNVTNKGTGWTPCHCAAFQAHGKVMLYLSQHKPNVTMKDSLGRTAADFGSALDTIWPFFAAMGCKRTNKADLIRLDIVERSTPAAEQPSNKDRQATTLQKIPAHFSRPGSAYIVNTQSLQQASKSNSQMAATAFAFGDVLREEVQIRQASGGQSTSGQGQETKIQVNMWRS